VVDEVVVGLEDAVGEPIVAHELPDVFHWIEFGGFRRQGDDGDVWRHEQARRHVPACLIDHQHGMGAWGNDLGNFDKMQVHRLGVASRHDQGGALAVLRADGAEDIGGGGALITGSARSCAAFCPPACDLVLLADARLILEPNLYCRDIDRLFARDFVQARGEVFLKSSIAPLAWA
jgi:hypothetical protein